MLYHLAKSALFTSLTSLLGLSYSSSVKRKTIFDVSDEIFVDGVLLFLDVDDILRFREVSPSLFLPRNLAVDVL